MEDIFVAGVGQTKFGELWDYDLRRLALEASTKALKTSDIDVKDIDAIYFGNMLGSRFAGQDHLGALLADELGIDIPASHIEAACASGGVALRMAWMDILSGNSKNVLVVGAEKMTDVSNEEATVGLAGASDEEWEASFGATFPSLYAMIAREHMNKYGTSKESLSMVSVKNHKHGAMNNCAHFPKEISLEIAMNATMISDPLNLFDCSPISDGAAAVVLSSEKQSGMKMLTSSQSQDTLALHNRKDITTLNATKKAADKAFKNVDIKREDIAVVELHDCFTIAEICAYEDLGFVEKGKGGDFIKSGITYYDSDLPVNTSGGLKSAGHPVGATGIKQVVEIFLQLTEQAGDRQITNNKKFGLTHNVGGSGATCVVSIFEKIK
jgi:acetyl-CoA C-acetyltransferase